MYLKRRNIAVSLVRAVNDVSEVTLAMHQKWHIRVWDVRKGKIKDPEAALQLYSSSCWVLNIHFIWLASGKNYSTERIPVTHIIGQLCKDLRDGLFVHIHKIDPTSLHL